jgi:hypothetical protein
LKTAQKNKGIFPRRLAAAGENPFIFLDWIIF